MGRSRCCDKMGLKKGTWTAEEDQKLLTYIEQHGHGSWRNLPEKAGLQRCGKSCRLRWNNYLRPDIKRGKFSMKEDQTIIQLHALLGNRWSAIASHLPKRTDNDIKNHWNTHLKKRLTRMGIDPATHKPTTTITLSPGQQKDTANLTHLAQWERARLDAEARLTRQLKMNSMSLPLQNKLSSLPPCLDVLRVWQAAWTRANLTAANLSSPISNGYGTLRSPTSISNFSDNILAHPSVTSFGANLPPFPVAENARLLQVGVRKEQNALNDIKYCVGIPNGEQLEIEDNAHMQLFFEDDLQYYPTLIAADVIDDSFPMHQNLVEGIASFRTHNFTDDQCPDARHSGIEKGFNGNLEEDDGRHWINITDDSAAFTYKWSSPVPF